MSRTRRMGPEVARLTESLYVSTYSLCCYWLVERVLRVYGAGACQKGGVLFGCFFARRLGRQYFLFRARGLE